MRDPKRIDGLLAALHVLWTKYPDQRFGQLVQNLHSDMSDEAGLFYVEDETWIDAILKAAGGDEEDGSTF